MQHLQINKRNLQVLTLKKVTPSLARLRMKRKKPVKNCQKRQLKLMMVTALKSRNLQKDEEGLLIRRYALREKGTRNHLLRIKKNVRLQNLQQGLLLKGYPQNLQPEKVRISARLQNLHLEIEKEFLNHHQDLHLTLEKDQNHQKRNFQNLHSGKKAHQYLLLNLQTGRAQLLL